MTNTILLLLTLSASVLSTKHTHPKPHHRHAARQEVAVSSPATTPVPNITALSADMNACLERIPQDLIGIIQAVESRLAAVQSQLSALGDVVSGIPVAIPNIAVSTSSLPASSPIASSVASSSLATQPSLLAVSSTSLPAVSPSASAPVGIFVSNDPTLCPPPDGLGPMVPCAGLITQTSFLTLTSTTSVQVTVQMPVPVSSPLPSISGPSLAVSTLAISNSTRVSLHVPSASLVTSSTILSATLSTVTLSSLLPTASSSTAPLPSVLTTASVSTVTLSSLLAAASLSTVTSPSSLTTASLSTSLQTEPLSFTTVTDFLSSSTSSVSSPTSSAYVFNANARDNLAVYYGNSPATSAGGLEALCNTNVDIVILSFVYDFFSADGYPSIDFGWSSCSGTTTAQASYAPGLKNCSILASQIQTCQSSGKKVLVSLGGYIANSSFTSNLEAANFATTLWDLFGAGVGEEDDLRPFGRDVVVDGFDIDNEDGSTAYWDSFASTLRSLYDSDSTKQYYLSAAPQCIYPDASIPMSAMQQADFVWVQFYNNPSCNLDSTGFESSFSEWSNALTNTSLATTPRVYIGALAFSGGGSGYVNASALSSRTSLAKDLFTSNFGGIMLWDGSEGLQNVDSLGDDYLQYAKSAMQY